MVETLGNPPLLAATATATKRVQQSIVANLGMRDPLVLVGGFNRPNLHFSVHRCKSENEREDKLDTRPAQAVRAGRQRADLCRHAQAVRAGV